MDPNVSDQLYLLYGANTLKSDESAPSRLSVEKKAFEVLRSDDNAIVVAAAPFSKGKIVEIAHEDYVTGQPYDSRKDDAYILVRNVFHWLTMGKQSATVGMLVTDGHYDSLSANLRAVPFYVKPISATTEDLSSVDAAFTTCYRRYTDEQLAAIRQFVTNGGGLLVAGRNWVQQTNYANNILLDCGITITIKASDRGVFSLPNPRYQPALFMLHNVSEITSNNQEASALTVEGSAFAVLWTKEGKCTVAAAPLGQGNIVEVGHEAYVDRMKPPAGSTDDAYIMIQNIVCWLAKCKRGAAVGVIPDGYKGFTQNISEAGYVVKAVKATQSELRTVDVLMTVCYTKFSKEECDNIRSFISLGKGLLLCGHNWANPTDYANDLLFDCGIKITSSYSGSQNNTYVLLPDGPPKQ